MGALLLIPLPYPSAVPLRFLPPPPPLPNRECHGSTSFGRVLSLGVCLLVFLLAGMVCAGLEDHPTFYFLLSITCVSGWLSLLRFAMGWESLAHFVVMIRQMVVEDVSRFLGVAGILLAAFTHAFFILGRFEWDAFGTVLFRALLALVGEGEVEVDNELGPRTGNTLFQVIYLVSGSLILLNVLIAMSAWQESTLLLVEGRFAPPAPLLD